MEQTVRKTDLDAIRIIASFGVVYSHVFGYRFFDAPGPGGLAAQFAFFLSKMAAPLFFMISGALLLPREDSWRKTFSRILRMAIVLTVMCLFYNLVDWRRTGGAFDWRALARSIYRDEPANTDGFWFLYRYLSVLVMLPILQRLVAGLEKKDFGYYLSIAAVAGGIAPMVRHLWPGLPGNAHLDLTVFSSYIGMMLLGLYIERHTGPNRRGAWMAVGGIVLFTAISVLLTRLDGNACIYGKLFYDNCAWLPIPAAAGCGFYLCKYLGAAVTLPERARKRIAALGRLTFCTYLFGDFFIRLLEPARVFLTQNHASYAGTLLYAAAAYGLSMLLAAALTRVPGLNKLL